VPGRDLVGVHFALDYLGCQIRLNAGEAAAEPIVAGGKRVLVIGGGDTGSDCVGTALRQGALEVHQVELLSRPPERRSPDMPWPSWPRLLKTTTSHEEGGSRRWGIATEFLEGGEGGVARWHGRDAATGEAFSLDVELVVLALGFLRAELGGVAEPLGLDVDAAGRVLCGPEGTTNVPSVFVTGDAALGASLVVRAIQAGRQTATAVDRFLAG
jgi:glutamate synthase (NADPH/NADH) small chain